MSSSSDSEDDTQMKQFMEATDCTLLTNSMFTENRAKKENFTDSPTESNKDKDLKSQRYLPEEDANIEDLSLPASLQMHVAKKVSEIIAQQVEFCDMGDYKNTKPRKTLNNVKLLSYSDTIVKSYEEFEYETLGPLKKPHIKRRIIEEDLSISKEDKFKSAAINPEYILNGIEVKSWAKKRERSDKVFHYKYGAKGVLYAKEAENEFTLLRKKNKWNESKIRLKKK